MEVAPECESLFARWRKSSRSRANGNCAEVGQGKARIAVRDTKQAHLGKARTVLEFSPDAWRAFTGGLKNEWPGTVLSWPAWPLCCWQHAGTHGGSREQGQVVRKDKRSRA